jgi:hypothetical protein
MSIVPGWYFLVNIGSIIGIILGPILFNIAHLEKKRFNFLLLIVFLCTRIVVLAVLYSTGWIGAYDSTAYFYNQGNLVLGGNIPYLDFESHYSPYFPYLMASFILFLNDARMIPIGLIVFDALVFFLSSRYTARVLSSGAQRMFQWIYVLIPTIWFFTVRANQDEIIMAFFLILSTLLILEKQEELGGISMGLGFLFTKFLIGLFFIPILLKARNKLRTTGLMCVVILIGYLPFILLGADIIMPLRAEGLSYANGANIWVLFEMFGFDTTVIGNVVLVCVLVVTLLVFLISDMTIKYSRIIPEKIRTFAANLALERRIAILGILFLIFSRKAWMFYLESFVVFLIISFIMVVNSETKTRTYALWTLFLSYAFLMTFVSYYSTFLLDNIHGPFSFDLLLSLIINLIGICVQILMLVIPLSGVKPGEMNIRQQNHQGWVDSSDADKIH